MILIVSQSLAVMCVCVLADKERNDHSRDVSEEGWTSKKRKSVCYSRSYSCS